MKGLNTKGGVLDEKIWRRFKERLLLHNKRKGWLRHTVKGREKRVKNVG